MKRIELLNVLKEERGGVFSTTDVAQITGKGKGYASLVVHRMVNAGLAKRAGRNLCYLPNSNVYAVASNVVYPSYISMFSAFAYYRITAQMPSTIEVITSKRHVGVDDVDGCRIRFITVRKSAMFGFRIDRESNAAIAEVEKAIVDSLYMNEPQYAYVAEAAGLAYRNGLLDVEKLRLYASRMNSAKVKASAAGLTKSLEAGTIEATMENG